MASFNSLEMADALSRMDDIHIKKSWFVTKAVYLPTQSGLHMMVREYSSVEGRKLEQMMSQPAAQWQQLLQSAGCPRRTDVGPYRLEMCISKDRRFAALQLFRYKDDYSYQPVTSLITCRQTGLDAVETLMK